MSRKKVILVKLGGSVITDKTVPNSVKKESLSRLLNELKIASRKNPEVKYILGHGAGSFAHYPAKKYGTAQGFKDDSSPFGMAVTQDSAAQLNRIVVKSALDLRIPAVSFYTSNTIITSKSKVQDYFLEPLLEYLKNGLLPVVSGDVLPDKKTGCTIWSADAILPFFGLYLINHGYQVKELIHVTETPGVWKDIQKPEDGIFSTISGANLDQVRKAIGETRGADVTGGMWTKISEAYALAKSGVNSQILSGQKPNNLLNALLGKQIGTKIMV